MTLQQIIAKAQKAEFIKFIKKAKEVENQKINVIFGANYDFKLKNYTNNYKKMIN